MRFWPFQESSTTDAFLKRHVSLLLQRFTSNFLTSLTLFFQTWLGHRAPLTPQSGDSAQQSWRFFASKLCCRQVSPALLVFRTLNIHNKFLFRPASNVHDVVDVLGKMIKSVENYEKSPVLETIKVETKLHWKLHSLEFNFLRSTLLLGKTQWSPSPQPASSLSSSSLWPAPCRPAGLN